MQSHDLRTKISIAAAFAAIWFVWGSTYLAISIAIDTVPPLTMAATRFLIAGLLVYGVQLLRRAPMPTLRQWRNAAVIGILMLSGGNGLVTWAEMSVPSSIAALLITTVPLWMAVLDGLVYGGARPRLRTWAGLILGFVGVAVLVRPTGDAATEWPILGSLALVAAAFSWANGSLLSRRVDLPESPSVALGAEMISGGLALGVVALIRGEFANFHLAAVSNDSLMAFVYLIVAGSILSLTAYMYLLRTVSATAVSTYAFVNPIVAVSLGWWIASEPITPTILLAGALIIVAVMVILIQPRRSRARLEPSSNTMDSSVGRADAIAPCEREARSEA